MSQHEAASLDRRHQFEEAAGSGAQQGHAVQGLTAHGGRGWRLRAQPGGSDEGAKADDDHDALHARSIGVAWGKRWREHGEGGDPGGIRTPVTAVKGRGAEPLHYRVEASPMVAPASTTLPRLRRIAARRQAARLSSTSRRNDRAIRARVTLGWSACQHARRMRTLPTARRAAAADSRITTLASTAGGYRDPLAGRVRLFAFCSQRKINPQLSAAQWHAGAGGPQSAGPRSPHNTR